MLIERATGEGGIDKRGAYIRNKESGFRIRIGDVQQEMLYDAYENNMLDFAEDLKRVGPVIGFHARWRF